MRKGEARRQAIVDASERLFYAKGYEGTSIQDILDALELSKGGFYHYFESKMALLEAICEQRAEVSFQAAEEAVNKCAGNAVEKLNAMFDKNGIWQDDALDYIGLLIRVTYREDGALLREKMKQKSYQLSVPLFRQIIAQGIREGLFFTPFPEGMGDLVMLMGQALTDEIALILSKTKEEPDDMMRILQKLELYRHAIERLLNAPHGSIVIYHMQRMTEVCQAIMEQNRRLAREVWGESGKAEG